jgi:hypothetical protein
LTIEEDVAVKLKAEIRRSGKPFKQVVNELLRRALLAKPSRKAAPPFRIKARPLYPRPGIDYDNIGALIEQLEGPLHR